MNRSLLSRFQLLKEHYFPSLMAYDLTTFEAHFQTQFWWLEGHTYARMAYMCTCVHTFFSVHRDAAFSRSFLVPFVLTCFTPHLCLLHTWQTKPSTCQIFWENTFFSARQLSVPFHCCWKQAHPSLHTPRWKRCLGSCADLLPGMQFPWGPLPRLWLGHLR